MRVLKFDERFRDDVEIGVKTQSVRREAKCRIGDPVLLCSDDGTPLAASKVVGLDTIQINPTCMYINGKLLLSILHSRDCDQTDNEFAQNDGFEGFMEMADWFESTYGPLPFHGVIIRWHPNVSAPDNLITPARPHPTNRRET